MNPEHTLRTNVYMTVKIYHTSALVISVIVVHILKYRTDLKEKDDKQI